MSGLPKLKLSQLFIWDRLNDMSEQQAMISESYQAQEIKLQLKDDGLGKYKIENENYVSIIIFRYLCCFKMKTSKQRRKV